MFAMVCLQTAHPDIYDLLSQNPDFQKWDDELAYKVTQGKEKLEENYELNYNQATKQGENREAVGLIFIISKGKAKRP